VQLEFLRGAALAGDSAWSDLPSILATVKSSTGPSLGVEEVKARWRAPYYWAPFILMGGWR
jgi:CHAT domain-containing protein